MVLMAHLHPVLRRQQINYRIFVVEQVSVYERKQYAPFSSETLIIVWKHDVQQSSHNEHCLCDGAEEKSLL